METPAPDYRSVGFWLKMPIVGPILCLALVFAVLAIFPNAIGGLFVWFLFAVGCVAIGMNVVRFVRFTLRR